MEDNTKPAYVVIYTDGACRGNPGKGGWGALLISDSGKEKEIYDGAMETTNNRMELTAVIEALRCLNRPCVIDLYTDSTYVKDGMLKWMDGWKRNNWRTAAKKAVKNQDLWQALDEACHRHQMSWHWVKGHAGNAGNERADQLANQAIDNLNR